MQKLIKENKCFVKFYAKRNRNIAFLFLVEIKESL